MTVSPAERERILELVAKRIVDELRTEAGGIDELVCLPLSTAAKFLSVTPRQAARVLAVTNVSPGRASITVANLRRHIFSNTSHNA